MKAVTAFGSSGCNYTKGELLIYAPNRYLLRSDAHQSKFLPFENLRAGLRVSLLSIFLGVVSLSNQSRTLGLSNRELINFGSG